MEIISIEYISVTSKLLDSVINLGDQCRATVGFFPKGAFFEAAKRKQIIGVFFGGKFAGHVVFRFANGNHKLIIVQMCVDPQFRGHGLAHYLVNHLDQAYPSIYIIELNCRRDYNLEDMWRKLGFTPVLQKIGRAQNGSELVTWRIQHDQPNLLNLIDTLERNEKFVAVLDTNIIIDLYNDSVRESSALLSDYMVLDVTYRITSDVYEEINKNRNSEERNSLLKYSSNFLMIDVFRDESCKTLTSNLLLEFDKNGSHEKDLSHVAQSIIGGAEAFITRDEWLLSQSVGVMQKYRIRIIGPAEFISQIDTFEQARSYSPLKLACTALVYRKFQWTDLAEVEKLTPFSTVYKKQTDFRSFLRSILSMPKDCNAIIIEKDQVIVGFYSVRKISQEDYKFDCFLINTNKLTTQLASTLARHLIMRVVQEHSIKARSLSIETLCLADILHPAFVACGFFANSKELIKVFLNGIQPKDMVVKQLKSYRYPYATCNLELIKHLDRLFLEDDFVQVEKLLWPLKIKDTNIPIYIIPIQAVFAIQLFGDLQPRLVPFDNAEPSLSIENIYFRSSKPVKLEFPARILWYVSDDKRHSNNYQMHIVACSHLDFVDVGPAKDIFMKYSRFGVLSWSNIMRITKNNPFGEVSALTFSYTEIFQRPIHYAEAVNIINLVKHCKPTFQSPYRIDNFIWEKLINLMEKCTT